MHLMIVNCSPRTKNKSNTTRIIEEFCKGYENGGNTSEVYYLSDRREWAQATEAFGKNTSILFALPLYVENLPGIMLEFLQQLPVKTVPGTQIAFLLQSGFPEASQLRCGETYIQTVPARLGCSYGGILMKGDMFGVRLMPDDMTAQMLSPLVEIGAQFAQRGRFETDFTMGYTGDEYLPKKTITKFNLLGRFMQKFFMGKVAKDLGCKERLDVKPLQDSVR